MYIYAAAIYSLLNENSSAFDTYIIKFAILYSLNNYILMILKYYKKNAIND